jgi:hypothetical protein
MSSEIVNHPKRTFLPAAGHDLFLPVYDPLVKPGGSFHLLDFTSDHDGSSHGLLSHGFLSRLMHSSDRLKDNSDARIIQLMARAGFYERGEDERGPDVPWFAAHRILSRDCVTTVEARTSIYVRAPREVAVH